MTGVQISRGRGVDEAWLPSPDGAVGGARLSLSEDGGSAAPASRADADDGLVSPSWLAQWRAGVGRLARHVVDFAYPPACIACRAATIDAGALCPACWSGMPFIERPYCERLGTPFDRDLGVGLISPQAFADPPVYERARAVARYDEGPARQLVQRLKYADRLEVAAPMGRWMARAGGELLADCDLIIPVPMHRRRLFARRFNQAAVLAQEVARASGRPWSPLILRRIKATAPQVGKTRRQRAENMQGAFRVDVRDRAAIAGRKLVLVDDVTTTGATANAAARVLLRAGAARVDLVVFALVVTGS